jgi:hypothetical protein
MLEFISGKEKGRFVNIGSKGFLITVINHVIEYRITNGFGVIKNTGMY